MCQKIVQKVCGKKGWDLGRMMKSVLLGEFIRFISKQIFEDFGGQG